MIAAATDAHTALIRAGVDAGIPVFCEKPLSGVVAEAIEIADYVNASGVPARSASVAGPTPPTSRRATRLASRRSRLGAHRLVHYLVPHPRAAGTRGFCRDLFRDCSVHDFYIGRWVAGREVVEGYATGNARGEDFFAEFGDVLTTHTLPTFVDGADRVASNTR